MRDTCEILICSCTHENVIPAAVRDEVRRELQAAGVAFREIDFCALAARRDPILKRIAEAGGVRVAACYPRAVKWLWHAAGMPISEDRLTLLNMRARDAAQVVAGLLADLPAGNVPSDEQQVQATGADGWIPWFPVIDYERCTNCQQCLNFCLFGVFGMDADGRIEVQDPAKCKIGCPACARVCPQVAIMFPKHDQRPINGAEVTEEDLQRPAVKVDLAALLGADAQCALRARDQQARRRFASKPAEQLSDQERLAQLKLVQAELGIPDGVLPSAPCQCECQRARAARQPPTDQDARPESEESTAQEWGI
ncbi:MAG: ferredoxin family protein [Planctomycetota bacterium]